MPCHGSPHLDGGALFCVLREAGSLLYDDGRGEWTPRNIYRHLVEQGRITGPMPVLREHSGGDDESATSS